MINDPEYYKNTLYATVRCCVELEIKLEVLSGLIYMLDGDENTMDIRTLELRKKAESNKEEIIPINFKAKNKDVLNGLKNINTELYEKHKSIKKKLDRWSNFRNKMVHCNLTKQYAKAKSKDVVLIMRYGRMFNNLNQKEQDVEFTYSYTKKEIIDYFMKAKLYNSVLQEIYDEIERMINEAVQRLEKKGKQ